MAADEAALNEITQVASSTIDNGRAADPDVLT
jgi:hypothetical protein